MTAEARCQGKKLLLPLPEQNAQNHGEAGQNEENPLHGCIQVLAQGHAGHSRVLRH